MFVGPALLNSGVSAVEVDIWEPHAHSHGHRDVVVDIAAGRNGPRLLIFALPDAPVFHVAEARRGRKKD